MNEEALQHLECKKRLQDETQPQPNSEVLKGVGKKGTKVFISGELTHDEYEGKPQFNVRVGSIDTGGAKGEPRPLDASVDPSKGDHSTWDNNQDLDDDVPF
mgnify:CR=1 FL=1